MKPELMKNNLHLLWKADKRKNARLMISSVRSNSQAVVGRANHIFEDKKAEVKPKK